MIDALASVFGLDENSVRLFETYISIIQKYGRAFGVTTIEDRNRIIVEHFWDSMMPIVFFRDIFQKEKVLDVGSGGGFPGLPLKIVRRGVSLTLLEANYKKVVFLRRLISALQLEDVRVLWDRLEKLPNEGKYDIILFRAVGMVFKLLAFLKPILSEGGMVFLYAGSNIKSYLKQIDEKKVGIVVKDVRKYLLPTMRKERYLIVLSIS